MNNARDTIISSAVDIEFLEALSSCYSLFGEYKEEVLKTALIISKNRSLTEMIDKLAEYVKKSTCNEAKAISFPETGDTSTDLMIPLFILLPSVDSAVDLYEKRGFSRDEVISFLGDDFRRCLSLTKMNKGNAGIDKIYYGWLCLYMKCEIFDHGIFNFQPQKFNSDMIVLKNRRTDDVFPVALCGKYHSSGLASGSAGCTDDSSSFEVVYSETEDLFNGHPVYKGKVSSSSKAFKKSEWECILRKGDDVLGLHIPRGVKLTDENTKAFLKSGMEKARRAFPEYSFKCISCHSWLLDPVLGDILGESSNIAVFAGNFLRFPVKSNGMGIFGFVFPRNYESFEDLPESTRLQRELKKMYINGRYIYVYGGVII